MAPDLVVSNFTFLQDPDACSALLVPTCEFKRALTLLYVTAGLRGGMAILCTHVSQQQQGCPCPPMAKTCVCVTGGGWL